MHHRRISRGRAAFTLIELMVVIIIIAVLASLALPLFSRIQAKGYETKTMSNMRVMGTALLAYAGDNSYQLPGRAPTGDKWTVVLRPYIQDLTVYGSPIPNVNGVSYKVTDPTLYVDPTKNYTSYIYNGGNELAAAGDANAAVNYPRLNVISMPSQTILLGVPLPQKSNWYMDFTNGDNNSILNRKAFADGTPYVFADGSSRVLAVDAKADNKAVPKSSGTYTDWLWLFDKTQTSVIQ